MTNLYAARIYFHSKKLKYNKKTLDFKIEYNIIKNNKILIVKWI